MFDIAPSELLVVGVVALIAIPPKDLPKAMRIAGQWIGRARGLARQFRSGFDEMIREAELAEMEKKWAAENERIMREHAPDLVAHDPAPAPAEPDAIVEPPPTMTEMPVLTHDPAAAPAPPAPAQ
jgi:sec-independent protein translocase protein TatB